MTKKWLLSLLLITLVLAAYSPVFKNGFVWDDEEQIINNILIKNLKNLPSFFSSSTFNLGGAAKMGGIYYRPLMLCFFAVNFALFGLKSSFYHFNQVFLHLLVCFLILLIFKKLAEKHDCSSNLPWVATLLFAVHPANIEAVAYLSAVHEVLALFFGLLTFYFIICFTQSKKENLVFLFLANLAWLLSFFSKESGFVFFLIIGLYLLLFYSKKVILWLVSASFTLSLYLFLRLGIAKVPISSHAFAPIAKAPLTVRFKTLPFEMFSYIRLFFFPEDLFVAQHQLVENFSDIRFWGSFLLIFPTIALIIYLLFKFKSKLFLFFTTWTALGFGLVANIFTLDMTIAERWLYLPMIGLLGMVVMIANCLLKKFTQKRIFLLIFSLIIVCFSWRSFLRVKDWQDNFTLFSHDEKLNPNAFDLQNNLGVALFRQGKVDETLGHFEKSIKLAPDWWISYNNAGVIYQQKGELAKAKTYYQKSIENGDYYLAYENLAFLLLKTDRQEAKKFLEQALAKLPFNPRLNLAAALISFEEGDYQKASQFAQKSFALQPSDEAQKLIQAIESQQKIH